MNYTKSDRAWIIGDNEECDHDRTFQLGSDKGNNIYLQCQDCNAVIILESHDYNVQKEREMIKEKMDEDENIVNKLFSR